MSDISANLSTGKDAYSLTANAAFDKVINVQFFHKPDATGHRDFFTIRSDYELIEKEDGTYYFVRMPLKPDIRIEYFQPASLTAISIKLHITNFRVIREGRQDVQHYNTGSGNAIGEVAVQIGYMNQFPDFSAKGSGLTKKDYYNLTDSPVGTGAIKTLRGTVLSAYATKLPPDGVTTLDIVVGSVTTFDPKGLKDPIRFGEKTPLSDYLYENITKKYLKYGAPTTAEPNEAGQYSNALADEFGVKVALSDSLADTLMDFPPELPPEKNVLSALNFFRSSVLTKIFMYPVSTGDYIMIRRDENRSIQDVAKSTQILDLVGRHATKIPAVEMLELGALANIRCPFFSFVDPFSPIQFQRVFNLSTFVGSFLASNKTIEFLPISCRISFATNSDENAMTIQCVSPFVTIPSSDSAPSAPTGGSQ